MLISVANAYADSLVNYIRMLTYDAKKAQVELIQPTTDTRFDLTIKFSYPDPKPVTVANQLNDVVDFEINYVVDTTYDITEYAPLFIAEANRQYTVWQAEHL